MAWPKRLVFVRHGESKGNLMTADERAGFALGSQKYNLTERGVLQAIITGQYLKKNFGLFDAYYTSYYTRARQTISLFYYPVIPYEDPRLAEAQRGIWHVLKKDDIQKILPYEVERKNRDELYHYRPLGGENWPDVELRIHSFFGTLARDYSGGNVLIVGHGNWFILFQRLIHHFSIDEVIRRYHEGTVENASITVYDGVEVNGKSRLVLDPNYDNFVPWKGIL